MSGMARWCFRRRGWVLIGWLALLVILGVAGRATGSAYSLLIPAVAAVMNLLAAGAAFGVLVAVFQYGWGLHLLNLGHAGPVESSLPVLMLAVLFGRANWWLPGWLDRILPHLSIEPASPPSSPATASSLTSSTRFKHPPATGLRLPLRHCRCPAVA